MSGRPWTPAEHARLVELLAEHVTYQAIAAELGRSTPAVSHRVIAYGLRPDPWWTRERTLAGLRAFAASNRDRPVNKHRYHALKRGRDEWPPVARILQWFGSFQAAWDEAGVASTRHRSAWTEAEDDILLELAGSVVLARIAARLRRSAIACQRRLEVLGAGRSRDCAGYLSASQAAALYGCPVSRVTTAIRRGLLPAHRIKGGTVWRIDPEDCERLRAYLAAPSRTRPGAYPRRLGGGRSASASRTAPAPAPSRIRYRPVVWRDAS